MEEFRLDGKTAVVTGAARGIGLATARRLAEFGARVALADKDATSLEEAARQLKEDGLDCRPLQADISSSRGCGSMIEQAAGLLGPVDILINNAGIGGRSVPIWEQSDDDWERMLAINLSSVFYSCRAALPSMRERNYGRIVNVASIAGKEGNPLAGPYSAAKAAVIGLTKSMAKEVATKNIRINAVSPAVIQTPILEQVSQEHLDYMVSRIPMGRVGQPAEVAAVIHFLVSEACSFVTGQCYDISGGRATY